MNMKRYLLVLLVLFLNSIDSSGSIQISVLTIGPGYDISSFYGHSALRIKIDSLKIDEVYDFALLQSKDGNFTKAFLLGELRCKTMKFNSTRYFNGYKKKNRSITEQHLNFMNQEALEVYREARNQLGKSVTYRINTSTCSTILNDVIEKYYNSEYENKNSIKRSLYSASSNYFYNAFSSVLLGEASEIKGKRDDFLPDLLYKKLSAATKENDKLVKNTLKLNDTINPTIKYYGIAGSFLIILIGGISYFYPKLFLYGYLLSTGLIALVILLISTQTAQVELQSNYNLVWINPLNLVLLILAIYRKIWIIWIFLIQILGTIVLLIWGVLTIDIIFLLIAFYLLISFIRSFDLIQFWRKYKTQ